MERERAMHIGRFFIAGLCAAIAFASVLRAADVNNYRVTIPRVELTAARSDARGRHARRGRRRL